LEALKRVAAAQNICDPSQRRCGKPAYRRRSEKRPNALRRRQAQVLIRAGGGDAAAGGALDQPPLQEVGLVDVLDRVLLLADGDRQSGKADRAAVELLDDRAEDLAVEPLEALRVHLQELQRI